MERHSESVPLGLTDTAEEAVGRYRDLAGVVLVRAGYLDLVGNVWGCVVSGPGWVEVCLVEERGEGESVVTTMRMEAEAWGEAYGGG